MFASVLLLPAFVLRSLSASAPAPAFDLSASTALTTPSTWLSPERIVDEPSVLAAAPLQVRATIPVTTSITRATTSTTLSDVTTRLAPTSTLGVTATTLGSKAAVATSTSSVARSTTTVAATTTTTRVVVALPALGPVTPAARPGAQSERGVASWYNAPDRTCAHRSAPKGTIIKVTRPSTGEWTTCEVADWGPADTSRVIDLSMDTFELLSHTGAGLIDVLIEW